MKPQRLGCTLSCVRCVRQLWHPGGVQVGSQLVYASPYIHINPHTNIWLSNHRWWTPLAYHFATTGFPGRDSWSRWPPLHTWFSPTISLWFVEATFQTASPHLFASPGGVKNILQAQQKINRHRWVENTRKQFPRSYGKEEKPEEIAKGNGLIAHNVFSLRICFPPATFRMQKGVLKIWSRLVYLWVRRCWALIRCVLASKTLQTKPFHVMCALGWAHAIRQGLVSALF